MGLMRCRERFRTLLLLWPHTPWSSAVKRFPLQTSSPFNFDLFPMWWGKLCVGRWKLERDFKGIKFSECLCWSGGSAVWPLVLFFLSAASSSCSSITLRSLAMKPTNPCCCPKLRSGDSLSFTSFIIGRISWKHHGHISEKYIIFCTFLGPMYNKISKIVYGPSIHQSIYCSFCLSINLLHIVTHFSTN